MRNLLTSILLIILVDLGFQRCANISNPTGGPRDTIPPILLESNPINGSTQFRQQEFSLTFSEFVKADKIQQQLIITPITENKYKTIIKKNTVILRFEEPFKDSTTYNFNFADAVTDITESNPAVNLSLAFSTGNYIDSLSIEGNVMDLFKQENVKGYLVGLYPSSDSLDFFKHKPTYFTTTNDSGKFKLNYLKSGIYKLLVFNDENRNITFDSETEPHGFIQDSIVLDSSRVFKRPIFTVLQDIKPIKFINSRPTGPYIELKYSKPIDQYEINPAFLNHSLTGESKDVIRIYKSELVTIGDSVQLISKVYDSLGNQTLDTIKTTFIESNRKPSEFSYSPKSNDSYLVDSLKLTVTFNKPISVFDTSKIYFKRDSTLRFAISPLLSWNSNRTKLTINTTNDRKFMLDTIKALIPKDTSQIEDTESRKRPDQKEKPLPPIELILDTATFISIENDTSLLQSLKIPLQESSSFGTVKLAVNTDHTSFNVQLLEGKDKVAHNSWNSKNISFPKVKPGKYSIRVLIDNNNDGKWSVGNLLLNTIPEEIYLHNEETAVRENWVLEIAISF